jgi:hypothetical protein
LTLPLSNVWRASGPGYYPFKILHPYNSHLSITHGALLFVVLSVLWRGMLMSSMVGDNSPILAFQSPHMTWAV